jgi:transcriptional regulator with XRE-family HTH domain
METVGLIVREARVALDISLRQLARQVGISATYLSHIEVNHVPPPAPDKVTRLAEALSLDPDRLLRAAGRWDEHALGVLKTRPALRGVFELAFGMDEEALQLLLKDIETRKARTTEKESLF